MVYGFAHPIMTHESLPEQLAGQGCMAQYF